MKVLNKPLLQHQIERIQAARLVDSVVLATTTSPSDDPLVSWAKELGISVFRGSENDVLARICDCLRAHQVDIQLEMLGDSPLPCPHLIDEVVGYYFKHLDEYDFVSNDILETYPAGMEVKVYPAKVLYEVEQLVPLGDPLREHVSYHIKSRPQNFRMKNLEAPTRFRRPDVFLEVDEPVDFDVISNVIENLGVKNPFFTLAQILDFLDDHKSITAQNQNVHRRWKQFQHEI